MVPVGSSLDGFSLKSMYSMVLHGQTNWRNNMQVFDPPNQLIHQNPPTIGWRSSEIRLKLAKGNSRMPQKASVWPATTRWVVLRHGIAKVLMPGVRGFSANPAPPPAPPARQVEVPTLDLDEPSEAGRGEDHVFLFVLLGFCCFGL